jgi:uncharacterized protein (TIGR02145 family)
MKTTRVQQITLLLLFALADLSAQSVVVNPHIRATFEKVAPTDVSGNYRLSGKTCFDVKRSNYNTECSVESTRTDNFASTKTFSYVFNNSADYTNLTFEVTDPNSLVASYTPSGANLSVTFISTIDTKATGVTKANPMTVTITAKFTDNTSAAKQISMVINVQDCSCGCIVKSTLAAGWLTFMCYNLGVAEATKSMSIADQLLKSSPTGSTTDSEVYGDLYQWGRKADGHEKRTSQSYLTNGTTAESSPITNANLDTDGQVLSAHAAYGKFIKNNADSHDWRVTLSTTLWNSGMPSAPVKTANDPCPSGWRVPTHTEWSSIVSGGTTSILAGATGTSGNKWTWNGSTGTHGYTVSPDGGTTTTLFLPAAGARDASSSTLYTAGTVGFYWSSTPYGSSYYSLLYFDSSYVVPSDLVRAYGFSVRCVAE